MTNCLLCDKPATIRQTTVYGGPVDVCEKHQLPDRPVVARLAVPKPVDDPRFEPRPWRPGE